MRRICLSVMKIHKKWIFITDMFDFNENDIRLINMEKALNILHIREKIPEDIFTSLELNALLEGYQNKGAKIASMLHRREIIPLRRGPAPPPPPLAFGTCYCNSSSVQAPLVLFDYQC